MIQSLHRHPLGKQSGQTIFCWRGAYVLSAAYFWGNVWHAKFGLSQSSVLRTHGGLDVVSVNFLQMHHEPHDLHLTPNLQQITVANQGLGWESDPQNMIISLFTVTKLTFNAWFFKYGIAQLCNLSIFPLPSSHLSTFDHSASPSSRSKRNPAASSKVSKKRASVTWWKMQTTPWRYWYHLV